MNRNVFPTGPKAPPANTVNDAGGAAYALEPREALEQYAMTGCFNGTFYASGTLQLERTLELCAKVADPAWISALAIKARRDGLMKDMPVLLLAWVAANEKGGESFRAAFPLVVDNVKQLSKYVQVFRSGVLGRKSLSHRNATAIERWCASKSAADLWWQSVGVASPSLADVLRMAHPKPATPAHAALFGYLSDRNTDEHAIDRGNLPENLRAWLGYDGGDQLPPAPFQLLVGHPKADWKAIARASTWAQARQSLNAYGAHGVFEDPELVALLAAKLAEPPERTMPYQILTTYQNIDAGTPRPIVDALHDALEKATANVPELPGSTLIAVDVSGSMRSPVTGSRGTATSKTRCVDVAALFACSMLRRNPSAEVVVFDTGIHAPRIEPRDSILTNAAKLAMYGGGGTDCSLPYAYATFEERGTPPKVYDLIVLISDNESWYVSCPVEAFRRPGTWAGQLWAEYSQRHKRSKTVLLDLTPNSTTQIMTARERVWNLGGFSDQIFDLIGRIAST